MKHGRVCPLAEKNPMKNLPCSIRRLAALVPLMLGACLLEGGPELHPQPQPPEEHELGRGAAQCPDSNASGGYYVSRDPARCRVIDFGCAENEQLFDDACGCGGMPSC